MLVIIPFWAGDKHLAVKLSEWIAELGGLEQHKFLLITDFTTDEKGVVEPLIEAGASKVESFKPHYQVKIQWGKGDGSTTGDATCPNNMFRAAAVKVLNHYKCPWLWLEPDAVPLKKGWLDAIEEEYKRLGKPFMGDQVLWPNAPEHMSGNGVYPARVCDYSILALRSGRGAFDVNAAHQIIRHAAYTQLIQHVWRFGGPGGQVPTFPDQQSLSQIEEEAVIFHRCKDGTLIDRLRERLSGTAVTTTTEAPISVSAATSAQSITVVFDPVAEKRRANLAKARAAKTAKALKRKERMEKKKLKHLASFPGPDAFHVVTGK